MIGFVEKLQKKVHKYNLHCGLTSLVGSVKIFLLETFKKPTIAVGFFLS